MDGHYAHHQQPYGPQFFFYNPEQSPENQQHGQFTQQPHGLSYPPQAMQPQQHMVMYSPNAYDRPQSASSQAHYMQMTPYGQPALMTPVQSPQPMYQKPTILVHQQQQEQFLYPLDTDCYAPSTPPLSTSGSTVSSPPSSAEIVPTPVYNNFQPQCIDIKPRCEEEAFSEMLAHDNWNHGASPPMTPGMHYFISPGCKV
jgi:hypothetical protein